MKKRGSRPQIGLVTVHAPPPYPESIADLCLSIGAAQVDARIARDRYLEARKSHQDAEAHVNLLHDRLAARVSSLQAAARIDEAASRGYDLSPSPEPASPDVD